MGVLPQDPSINLCFNAEEGVLFAKQARNKPIKSNGLLLGIKIFEAYYPNPLTTVRLPEALVQQILETHQANIEVIRKQYELQEYVETINASSSDTIPDPVHTVKYNLSETVTEYFIPSYKLCVNTDGVIVSADRPRNKIITGNYVTFFGRALYDGRISLTEACTDLMLPQAFVQQVQDTYTLLRQATDKNDRLLSDHDFIAACSDITVPPIEFDRQTDLLPV